MLQLFDHPLSPYALKVRILLYEKGLEFEKKEIRRHDQRDELLRLNPRGEVPALRDGDVVIYDSRVIAEYVEDRWPTPPMLPPDPAGRARARAIELVADTQVDACAVGVALFGFFRPALKETHPEALARTTELLRKHHENLDRELAGREHFAGPFSRADIAVLPHVAMPAAIGFGVPPECTRLTAWLERVQSRPSAQRAMQDAFAAFAESQEEKDPFFAHDRLHWRNDRIEYLLRVGLGPWLLDELRADRAFFSPVP